MTAARRQRKRLGMIAAPAAAVMGVLALCSALDSGLVHAATTERIVTDEQTGLAIGGFDPVGYFVDAKPGRGKPAIELGYGGADWRFRNEGNRAAFKANPDIYMPRFGGYDPTRLARGVALPGNPDFWLIVGERLYLFYSPDARAVFAANPDEIIAAADKRWPQILRSLVP